MNELQSILLSDMPLLISTDGYRRLMVSAFPPQGATAFFFGETKTYSQTSREAFEDIRRMLHAQSAVIASMPGERDPDITLTMDYESPELPQDSVAYHRVWGIITSDSRWYFSSKRMEQELLQADQNPQISAHLLHVNSPGGEAWYLDRLSETLRNLQKPVFTLYEMMCSAAVYIGCHGSKVYATTPFDFVGCIGTMTSFWDFRPYYEQLGIKYVEAKATQSDLKNKMFDNLRDGHPKQYIEEVLDPLNASFLSEVKAMRPRIASLDDDAPVLRGETFYTPAAEDIGLCDGQRTLLDVVAECYQAGCAWRRTTEKKQSFYQIL